MLDFRVQTFLTVCRTLNYTRAAEELSITQPAVSQHISYLEKHYGTKLFCMSGKRPTITEAGKLLFKAFSAMSHDEAMLDEHVRALCDARAVELRVGMTLTAGEFVVAPALGRWLARNPDARVVTRSGDTRSLLGQLDAGEIDCAFVEGLFDRSAYRYDTLCRERLVCACAPWHPLAGRAARLEDILNEHLIVREKGSGTRAVLENALAARNLSVESFGHRSEASSVGVIKALVKCGAGVTFLYEAAVREELKQGTLALIDLPDEETIEHDIAFVRLAGGVFEDVLDGFFRAISAEA